MAASSARSAAEPLRFDSIAMKPWDWWRTNWSTEKHRPSPSACMGRLIRQAFGIDLIDAGIGT